MDVGIIGLGHMGQGMARALLKAGHRVMVYNRTRSKAEALAKDGAQIAERPADACRGDALITMVADDAALEAVVFGEGGVLAALGANTVHVSSSTISVALSERLTEAHARAGRTYLAAPVMGRPDAAAAGKLFVLTAGPKEAADRCGPLFAAIGQKTFVLGDRPPAANVVKLAMNFMISSMLESLGEAFALIRKSEIDPHRFHEVLTGSLFAAPAYKTYASIIADEKYDPPGFRMWMGLKDIRLALAQADVKQVPMPAASLVRDHFLAGVAQGHADEDWSALARLCAVEAGLSS